MAGILLVLGLWYGQAQISCPTIITIERSYAVDENGDIYLYDVDVYEKYQSPADKYRW